MAEFGMKDDFDALLDRLHSRDMKLIMDLVLNTAPTDTNGLLNQGRPETVLSATTRFGGTERTGASSTTGRPFLPPPPGAIDQDTNQWYLHLFSEKQPDLNWENPLLGESACAMINRRPDKSDDGFRMDELLQT